MSPPEPAPTAFRERTSLAWQRTGLSLLGGALVMLRLRGGAGGWATATLIAAGGLLGALAALESRRLSRRGAEAGDGVGRVALLMSVALTLLLIAELEVALLRL